MRKEIKNIPASVHEKLLILGKKLNIDFNRLLLLYAQEKFLYRLSFSKYRENFILKGGVLMNGIHQFKSRPTKDIDFLIKNLKNKHKVIEKVVDEIISSEENDGLQFDNSSLLIEEIVENAQYHGLRIKVNVSLGKARVSLQIDLAFGDVVIPEPISFTYPSLMGEIGFNVNAYPGNP